MKSWVQAGAILGEHYTKIAEKSKTLAFPAGICSTVGAGGHISGGGYGNLIRKHGLSVDHVVDAQLVDVNGKILNRSSMGVEVQALVLFSHIQSNGIFILVASVGYFGMR
ncbi:hypothetical protein DY000_02063485 [Brassica cretica]|uniref:FAD linked oxidase N-terminal domain-containing protein n=1 Tax=Brassica cretica TaxID=69181 RepID=A0ABQ7AVN4_BRACR|nr:hypothetical protein DY000_02063485 [Brassica cretica]